MKHLYTILVTFFLTLNTFGQVGINTATPDASSALQIDSTNGGILIPRLQQADRDNILEPATGLMIYQTDAIAGFYYYNGSEWAAVGARLVSYENYVGDSDADCPGGYLQNILGYDLDMSNSLEGSEIVTTITACNALPTIGADALTVIDDCYATSIIPVTLSDSDGTVVSVSVSVKTSGSSFTPTIDLDGNLTIPPGPHEAGAVLTITATDNYGAESLKDISVRFTGSGCIELTTFYGVQPDTCISIEVDGLAGDDRGGVTLTADYAYYNGDNGLVRTDLNLENLTLVSNNDIDTLIGDPLTGTLYTLWSSTFTYTNLQDITNNALEDNGDSVATWDQLAIIDETTFEVLSKVTLESPVYVPIDNNTYDFDFGAGVEENAQTVDIMVGMRDGYILIASRIYEYTTNDSAIEMRLVDAETGLNLSSTTVNNLNSTTDDDLAFNSLMWDRQEVDIQHYLLLERDEDHFITYRQNNSGNMIEVNVSTGEYTTVSTTFGTDADLSNLALDASGLYAYFHTEDGFMEYREESMDKCRVLFSENDGSVDDAGNDY
jgi:hypothetical protein